MIRCGSKNGHQKDKCFKEIGLLAQKYAIHYGFDCQCGWWDLLDCLMSTRVCTLIITIDTHMSFGSDEANGYGHYSDLLIILNQLCGLYPTRSECREIVAK